tara:strand:+ start:3967 stop:4749 length:783 start_codon:yes stop_codon:yes gene_type:complete
MINKIIHFSDLHLRLFKEHTRYREVLTECFKQWREINPDRIVFTGDLVHSKNQMTPELLEIVSWVLIECESICPVIVLIGNHDFLENNQDRLDTLSPIIDNLNKPNITYFKHKGCYEDDNVLWCVYSLMEENERPTLPTTTEKHKIGLFHGPIEGSKTDLGFMFESGYSLKEFKGLDVVLAGDIHKRQIFDIDNNSKVYMVGSLIQQNFGETIKNHGYGVYELKNKVYNFIDVKSSSPYLSFRIKDISDIEKQKEKLLNV